MPRQAPVHSRPCSSLEFCLPLCAQAALPHVFSMTGEVGRATCPWLEGNTVASEARKGRKDGSNVQGHSDLCCSLWVDSVYPLLSTTAPHTSGLGCKSSVQCSTFPYIFQFLISGDEDPAPCIPPPPKQNKQPPAAPEHGYFQARRLGQSWTTPEPKPKSEIGSGAGGGSFTLSDGPKWGSCPRTQFSWLPGGGG